MVERAEAEEAEAEAHEVTLVVAVVEVVAAVAGTGRARAGEGAALVAVFLLEELRGREEAHSRFHGGARAAAASAWRWKRIHLDFAARGEVLRPPQSRNRYA